MITITQTNVNQVYPVGVYHLRTMGVQQDSQHGKTLEMGQPVSVMYSNPRERILFDKTRDSNPFLNFFEALWIIQGRYDVKFLEYLVSNMAKYSDNGKTYHGAYGDRMFGGRNQVDEAIRRLICNKDDRQVVIMIREPMDMFYSGKDNPCNLLVSCKIRNGKLNIHVFNRSNDFVWGLTGTNVVQFSMLQEYMAGMIGVEVGTYHQTTDSMHVYENDQWEKVRKMNVEDTYDPYADGSVAPYDMMQEPYFWDKDLENFFIMFDSGEKIGMKTPFFSRTVIPMWNVFKMYKRWKEDKGKSKGSEGYISLDDIIEYCSLINAQDWQLICKQWLGRRGGVK